MKRCVDESTKAAFLSISYDTDVKNRERGEVAPTTCLLYLIMYKNGCTLYILLYLVLPKDYGHSLTYCQKRPLAHTYSPCLHILTITISKGYSTYFYCRIIQGNTCNKSTPFIHKIHIILIKSNGSVLTNRLNLIKCMIKKDRHEQTQLAHLKLWH